MEKIVRIAESLANLYDADVLRVDIQYSEMKKIMVGYVHIGCRHSAGSEYEFQVLPDGRFFKL